MQRKGLGDESRRIDDHPYSGGGLSSDVSTAGAENIEGTEYSTFPEHDGD